MNTTHRFADPAALWTSSAKLITILALISILLFALPGQADDAQAQPKEAKPANSTTPVMNLTKTIAAEGYPDIKRQYSPFGKDNPGALRGMRQAMYEQVEQYVRFGSYSLALKEMIGPPVYRVDGEDNKREDHRRKVAHRVWCLKDYPVIVPEDNEKSTRDGKLVVFCPVELRLTIRPKEGKDFSSDSLWRLHTKWTSIAKMWFLNKDGKLQECKDSLEVMAVERAKGLLYIKDGTTTELAFILNVEEALQKKIRQNRTDYKVDLIFDQLEYRQAFDWGYYRKDKLIEADWDSQALIDWNSTGAFGDVKDPHYFRPVGVKKPSLVCANLVSAVLKDKEGKEIASYKRETEYGEFAIVQQPDETPKDVRKKKLKQK